MRSRSRGVRKPSVILVRESEEQLTGSSCCGRLEGDFLKCEDGRVFAERRAAIEAMGPLYRALRDRFGDAVQIDVIDPRNLFSLLFLLVRDFWRFRVGVLEAVRTLVRLPVQAVIVNGRLVARGRWPRAADMLHLIDGLAQGAPTRLTVGAARRTGVGRDLL